MGLLYLFYLIGVCVCVYVCVFVYCTMQSKSYTAQCTTHTNKDWINIQPLDRTDSVNDLF